LAEVCTVAVPLVTVELDVTYRLFRRPLHLAVDLHVAGGRLIVADYNCVALLDTELGVDRVLLLPDNDNDNDDDDTERFSRPLRLSYSARARRLLVACRSQFVSVYSWRPPLSSTAVTDSPTRAET